MKRIKPGFFRVAGALVAAVIILASGGSASASTETVLLNFDLGAAIGFPVGNLASGLLADRTGNLYGTTYEGGYDSGGTVYELTPPSTTGGKWTASALWNFASLDIGTGQVYPALPTAGLVMDRWGQLYGTTSVGGEYAGNSYEGAGGGVGVGGTVFRLTPPRTAGESWRESLLWAFGKYPDGAIPLSALIIDANGNLYGTTAGGGPFSHAQEKGKGTVFKLNKPATSGGTWTESVLWNFAGGSADGENPEAGLISDASGSLYGTTDGGGAFGFGTVFELSADGTESVLWSFGKGSDGQTPFAPVIMDANGNLYGTTNAGGTNGNGTVFELNPPTADGTGWTESILWNFDVADGQYPGRSGVVMDSSGHLFGTTTQGGGRGYGAVFKLMPPNVAGGSWSESRPWNFGNGNDGKTPNGGLLLDESGNLFGANAEGGTKGYGTVFEISNIGNPTPTPTP